MVIADAAPGEALAGLEEIILVSSESIQAQTLASALHTVAILLDAAPPWRGRLADIVERALSSLGEHVLSLGLALVELATALDASGAAGVAGHLREASQTLARSLGVLNSRSTRVPMG